MGRKSPRNDPPHPMFSSLFLSSHLFKVDLEVKKGKKGKEKWIPISFLRWKSGATSNSTH